MWITDFAYNCDLKHRENHVSTDAASEASFVRVSFVGAEQRPFHSNHRPFFIHGVFCFNRAGELIFRWVRRLAIRRQILVLQLLSSESVCTGALCLDHRVQCESIVSEDKRHQWRATTHIGEAVLDLVELLLHQVHVGAVRQVLPELLDFFFGKSTL